jgi:AcrR family transcriptional regulator
MMQDRRASRRDEILAIATELFAAKGYHATSVRDITRAVGMSKAGLYSSFSSKESILEEIYYSVIDGMLDNLREIASSDAGPSQKLRQAIMAHVKGVAQRVPELTIYYRERHHLPEETAGRIQMRRRTYQEMVESIIREGIATGDFVPVDIPVTAYGIAGMCAWTHQWFQPGGRLSSEEVGSLYADIVIRGLCLDRQIE